MVLFDGLLIMLLHGKTQWFVNSAGIDCFVGLRVKSSGDGIDGSRRCFLEYEDTLQTNTQFILSESEGTMERLADVGMYKVTCREYKTEPPI